MVEVRRDLSHAAWYDDLLQSQVDARIDDKIELDKLDQAENHHASLTSESILNNQKKLLSGKEQSNGVNKRHPEDVGILSQAVILLIAGFDPTRAFLVIMTYLLAHYQDVQEKLYEEISKLALKRRLESGSFSTTTS